MSESLEKRLNEALEFIRQQREQIARLRGRLDRLEKVVDLCFSDDDGLWLYQNREERCDPSVPIFDAERGAFHTARYLFACDYVAGKRVLDIACGTGYGSQLLGEQGKALEVIGIDISYEAVGYAARRHCSANTRFLAGSATEIPLPDHSVDVVVSFETIEHIPEDTQVIAEFARVLPSGGTLVISTPNNWPLEIAPFHTNVYDRQSFLKLLETQFSVVQLLNQNSGSSFKYNHQQPAGIVATTDENAELAECFIAVATKR
ncbi:MAG: class I SAM-dependent methyltransferase [Pirellulaceae bacterium]